MSWLSFNQAPTPMSRLDDAFASNMAAQEGLRQEGEETAASAALARRKTIVARRRTRKASRKIGGQTMRTGDVRTLVEDMLLSMEPESRQRKETGPC